MIALVQYRLEPARRIVRQVTDGPASQRREASTVCQMLVSEILPEKFEAWLIQHFTPAVAIDDCLPVLRARHHEWIRPDKGIPRNALATFDRFQQKRVRRISGDSQK